MKKKIKKIKIKLPMNYYNALIKRLELWDEDINTIEDYLMLMCENDHHVSQFLDDEKEELEKEDE